MTTTAPPPDQPTDPSGPSGPSDPSRDGGGPPFVLGVDRDPTAVMGRRIGAYLVDVLVPLLVALLAVLAAADIRERPELASCRNASEVCAQLGDRVFTSGWAPVLLLWAIPLAYGVVFAVLVQGVVGATPGKALFGLRVVDHEGRRPGVTKALVRWLLLVVDGIGCGLPLVGLITASASRGHRRVGDMVARTFVVDRHDTGRAIVLPGAPTSTAWTPGPYPGTAPPLLGTPTAPSSPPGPPSPSTPPHGTGVGPSAGPGEGPRPQWDERRGAYVLWDPVHQRWLVHDQASSDWRPL